MTERKSGSYSITSHLETGCSAGNEKFPGVSIYVFHDEETSGSECMSKREGELIWHIMMSMAQIERQQAIERTKDAMRYRKRHNLPCNRKAPVAFKVVGLKGCLRFEVAPLDRIWGDWIRKMKEEEGRSLERISWDLGKQFWQTKDDRQRQCYANPRTGGPFNFTQVRSYYPAASTGYPIVSQDTCRKMVTEFRDGLREASRGVESENETLRTMAEANAQAFKHRQRELFENVAVRQAVAGYLRRKKKQNEYDDELLTMLLAMNKKEAATGASSKSLPENGEQCRL